jgi:hypothetical protein
MHANVAHHEQLLQAQNDTRKGTNNFLGPTLNHSYDHILSKCHRIDGEKDFDQPPSKVQCQLQEWTAATTVKVS